MMAALLGDRLHCGWGYCERMSAYEDSARGLLDRLEQAVEHLATDPGYIQQRLADAYVSSHLGEEANMRGELFPEVYALQLDLRSALSTTHDSERGSAAASAAVLSDDHCTILGGGSCKPRHSCTSSASACIEAARVAHAGGVCRCLPGGAYRLGDRTLFFS